MVSPEGEVRPFNRFPISVLVHLREEIRKDPDLEATLEEVAESGLDELKMFVRCRFGAFNNQHDLCLATGKMESEYVACENRGNCKHEGVICRSELTPREMEVTRLIADDLGDKQIADRLHISPHTVARHRVSIEQKLGLASKMGITRFACLNQLNH